MKKIGFKQKQYNKEKIIELSKLILAFALTLPLIITHFVMLGVSDHSWMMGMEWYALFAATFVQFGLGYKFYKWGYEEVFIDKRLGMSTLIMMSTLISYCWSFGIFVYMVAGNSLDFNHDMKSDYMSFFEVGASVISFALLGNFISDQLYKNINYDIESVVRLQVDHAELYNLKTKTHTTVNASDIKIGNYLLVKNNQQIPVDGTLIDTSTYINETILTGEAKPVLKAAGAYVYAGTVNLGQNIVVQAQVDNNNTLLSSIINKVVEIQNAKPKIQKMVDKLTIWFTPLILLLAVSAFLINFFAGYDIQIWLGINNWAEIPHFVESGKEQYVFINILSASFFSIAMIAIACPCALGLATPLAIVIGIGIASKNNIVFNTKEIFEKIKHLNAIAFDKTGTLTIGKLTVIDSTDKSNQYRDLAYSLEIQSVHPLAESLVTYLKVKKAKTLKIKNFHEEIGFGLQGEYENHRYVISSLNKLLAQGYKLAEPMPKNTVDYTYLALAKEKQIVAVYTLKDSLNPNAHRVIEYLNKNHVETYMITGDSLEKAKLVADELGITKYFADVKPSQKGEIIEKLKAEGKVIAYVGDGVNDLIALKNADLAISVSLTNQSAKDIADLNIVNGDIINIYKAIKITKLTRKSIIWNLVWAFGYNIITIPLAFLGIVPVIVAPIVMGFSDVSLIVNTLVYKKIMQKAMNKLVKY